MEINGFWTVFSLGYFGGILAEALKWYRLRESPNLPHYAKSIRYWASTVVVAVLGGVLTTLYGVANVNAILAVNIGATAPLIISALASSVPPPPPLPAPMPVSLPSGTEQDMRLMLVRKGPSIVDFLAGR